MPDEQNLIPTCTQGCHSELSCCACCIYIPNLSMDDLRTMMVERVYLRILTDPEFREERRKRYEESFRKATP